jgi:uncharacterized phiE125 gp8 family phage protein
MAYGIGIQTVVAPTFEPLQATDIIAHLKLRRADAAAETAVINSFISVAREFIETVNGITIPQTTYLAVYDQFPGMRIDDRRPYGWRYGVIRVPRPPLISVTQIQYIDTSQVLQTLATSEYQYSAKKIPGKIAPAPFKVWPQTDPLSFDAVQVTYVAGHASAGVIPNVILQAIKYLVGHLYENREATSPSQVLHNIPYGLMSMIRACNPGEVL